MAAEAGLARGTLRGGDFVLTRYLRHDGAPELLTVYLDGDARAWHRDGVRVAAEPPPLSPLALELAARDPAADVAWLGRPCQLVRPADASGCAPPVWSHARFSEAVVAALDEALDGLRRETGARRLGLVGYSGGGVLATLLAARRNDVAWLLTLAAPLDLGAWVAHHDLGALDAADPATLSASALGNVRQHHLGGERDAVVPPRLLLGYGRSRPAARIEIIPGRGHGQWTRGWADRIQAVRSPGP